MDRIETEEIRESQQELLELILSKEGVEIFARYMDQMEFTDELVKRSFFEENETLSAQNCALILYQWGKFFMREIEFMRDLIDKGDKYTKVCDKWKSQNR